MDHTLKLTLLLLLFIGVACTCASTTTRNFKQCEDTVKQWASSSGDLDVKEDKHILRELLFFLHVPRTGGRTYFHCFLKKLYSSSFECPRSYDKLRFNPSKPNCRLLASHDDYSMMSKLPNDKTSVVTILRNPIERTFSTYEFSVEVAARFLIHPNLTSAIRMSGRVRSKTKGVSTLDIWPWKYLVPWMREDLFARREARKRKGSVYTKAKSNDSYNMEDIVMPLLEYIHDPITMDIVHNGATFQVAGLTNSSSLRESHEVRHCVVKYQQLGEYVLEVAKKRLDDMLYVGLTEKHKESATMFANVVGAQVISQLMVLNSSTELAASNESAHATSSPKSKPDASLEKHQMTVEKLNEVYKTCVSSLRKAQAQRRNSSLINISPVNFTKGERRNVPERVVLDIASLNNLDMQLYKYAQDIFLKQHKHMVQKLVDSDMQKSRSRYSLEIPSWKFLTLATVIMLLFFIFLLVAARGRTLKLNYKFDLKKI